MAQMTTKFKDKKCGHSMARQHTGYVSRRTVAQVEAVPTLGRAHRGEDINHRMKKKPNDIVKCNQVEQNLCKCTTTPIVACTRRSGVHTCGSRTEAK